MNKFEPPPRHGILLGGRNTKLAPKPERSMTASLVLSRNSFRKAYPSRFMVLERYHAGVWDGRLRPPNGIDRPRSRMETESFEDCMSTRQCSDPSSGCHPPAAVPQMKTNIIPGLLSLSQSSRDNSRVIHVYISEKTHLPTDPDGWAVCDKRRVQPRAWASTRLASNGTQVLRACIKQET